jgi:hypothetical protein
MRGLAAFALMSFVVAAMLPDPAPAQTPSVKGADAGKQAGKHKKARKAQLQVQTRAPAPASPVLPYEERSGPKMGM